MAVNLNLYKYFIAVMEERSITKAASKMGVSQPTVTYNIKELEKDLNEQLFIVGRHGICPVRRAVVLYQSIKPVYVLLINLIENFIRRR